MADINLNNLDGIPFGVNAGRPTNPQPGQPYFNGELNRLELYTQAVGWQNIVQETPSVVNVVGSLNETTSSTLTINGSNFAVGAIAYAVGTNGTETVSTTSTLVSVVELTAVFPALSPANEPYDIKVVNPSNLYGILYDALTVDNQPAWTTSSGSLGTYVEQSPMSVTVTATDAVDALSSALIYSISSGALPSGLSINSATGVISGTPADVVGSTTYSFTAAAYDGRNTAVTRNFSITISDRGPSWSTSATLPTFTNNSAYTTTLVATDDNGIASYSLVSGSLPTGLSLNGSSGVISGTPTSSSSATFTIRATDNGGSVADRQFTMPNVSPVWVSFSPPSAEVGASYSYQFAATDDGTIASYAVASGSIPTGLTLSSAGLLSGTPTAAGTFNFVVRATDNNGGQTLSSSISISAQVFLSYLVVAGGGSGGNGHNNSWQRVGGGGGAGGFRTSFGSSSGGGGSIEQKVALSLGTNYTVTVGAGGSGAGGTPQVGNNGNNSVFDTITSLGGGGGGQGQTGNPHGLAGGSGGGGGGSESQYSAGGARTTGQGFQGGDGSGNTGGGGGGAGAVGSNASGSNGTAGPGGAGLASSITNSSVTYAGGGGGGDQGSGAAGGAGGGGAGGGSSAQSVAGSANTGSGGGGGSNNGVNPSSSGGSGVVIVRSPVVAASTTGSPDTTGTGSGVFVYKFNNSGSITF
jgi:hypothetical protein